MYLTRWEKTVTTIATTKNKLFIRCLFFYSMLNDFFLLFASLSRSPISQCFTSVSLLSFFFVAILQQWLHIYCDNGKYCLCVAIWDHCVDHHFSFCRDVVWILNLLPHQPYFNFAFCLIVMCGFSVFPCFSSFTLKLTQLNLFNDIHTFQIREVRRRNGVGDKKSSSWFRVYVRAYFVHKPHKVSTKYQTTENTANV